MICIRVSSSSLLLPIFLSGILILSKASEVAALAQIFSPSMSVTLGHSKLQSAAMEYSKAWDSCVRMRLQSYGITLGEKQVFEDTMHTDSSTPPLSPTTRIPLTEPTTTNQPSAPMVPESVWLEDFFYSPDCCAGPKKRRVNGNSCSLVSSSCQDAGGVRSNPLQSDYNTSSYVSSCALFSRGATENECLPTSLGLCLKTVTSSKLSEKRSFGSLISGEGSVLTSATSGSPRFDLLDAAERLPLSFLLGPEVTGKQSTKNKEIKSLYGTNTDPIIHDLQLPLQLSVSGTSSVSEDGLISSRLALEEGGTYDHGRINTLSHENIPVVDEGSTSSRLIKAGGYMPSLLMGRKLDSFSSFGIQNQKQQSAEIKEMNVLENPCLEKADGIASKDTESQSDMVLRMSISSGQTSASLPSVGLGRSQKTCKFMGCGKAARGASGLCIIHRGGRRCQRQGCNKGAEGSTVYCKSHGGGRRCQRLGCTKSAEGRTDYCIAHGGGRRCSHEGCPKAARGRSGLCIRHGGGKRCQKEGCTKSAEGYSGLCISHGGGRRCQYEGCSKGAQGSTMFCKAHGGGKRCMIQGCNKGAEGSTPLCKGHGGGKRCMFQGGGICTKSVHGGTNFCVGHGGGKRCAVKDCTKSARGRTDYCVRHGGGKRCKVENCTKSAQGSTDFCKAHGGGKRCSWGQESSPYSKIFKEKMGDAFKGPCERFARGKLGLCAAHCALVQDRRVHGVGTVKNTLSSGIGPGLFRGLVEESITASCRAESAGSTDKVSMASRNGLGEVCSESIRLGRLMCGSGTSSHEVELMEEAEMHNYPINTLGCKPGSDSIEGNLLEKARGSPSDVDLRSVMLSGCDLGLSSNHSMNGHTPGVLASRGAMASNRSSLKAATTGADASFYRPILPPQVLVPPSMRATEFPREGVTQSGPSNICHGYFLEAPLECSPPYIEAGQRRHGSNEWTLLNKSKRHFSTEIYE